MSKRKAEVGVEAPKRPQSVFGQFFAEKRSEISATLLKEGLEAKKILTASAKRAGEMWKALGAAKQASYKEKSEKLVLAWRKELEAFKTANPDYQKVKKLKKEDKPPTRPAGGYSMVKKAYKEVRPPTRPAGGYSMWLGANRAMLLKKIMKEHKVERGKAFLLLYKEGKLVYDALSAEEKKQWVKNSEVAKLKFQEDMKEWKENRKGKNKGEGPKRPRKAYPQWLQDNRPMLIEKVMKQFSVDKSQAFLMLYKEARPVYDALPAAEKKKREHQATAAKKKFQAACKARKEKGGEAATRKGRPLQGRGGRYKGGRPLKAGG
jgi:hypothetical protein